MFLIVITLMLCVLAATGAYAYFDNTDATGVVIRDHHFAPVAHWIPEGVTAGVLGMLVLLACIYGIFRVHGLRRELNRLYRYNLRLTEAARAPATEPSATLRGETVPMEAGKEAGKEKAAIAP